MLAGRAWVLALCHVDHAMAAPKGPLWNNQPRCAGGLGLKNLWPVWIPSSQAALLMVGPSPSPCRGGASRELCVSPTLPQGTTPPPFQPPLRAGEKARPTSEASDGQSAMEMVILYWVLLREETGGNGHLVLGVAEGRDSASPTPQHKKPACSWRLTFRSGQAEGQAPLPAPKMLPAHTCRSLCRTRCKTAGA